MYFYVKKIEYKFYKYFDDIFLKKKRFIVGYKVG